MLPRFSSSQYRTYHLEWESGQYYPLGTIGTVPRAYEGMEGTEIKIKKLKL
jgi:hypothetical protein